MGPHWLGVGLWLGHWLGVGLGLEGRHRPQPPPRVRVLASVTLVQGSGSYAPGTLLQHVCSMLGEVAYGALLVRPCLSFLCLGCELRIPLFQCFFFYYSQRDGARWAVGASPRGRRGESGRGAPRARAADGRVAARLSDRWRHPRAFVF